MSNLQPDSLSARLFDNLRMVQVRGKLCIRGVVVQEVE